MDQQNIEDIYPLSPMQQGLLFHSLFAPESGIYTEQVSCTLDMRLDRSLFEQAWQRIVERHPILRTAYVWEDLDEPLQIVQRRVRLGVNHLDWRGLSPEKQQEGIRGYLDEDRRRGFDFSSVPMMRVALMQLAEASYHFVWTFHHSLLDGSSAERILKEVLAQYEALSRSEPARLEPSPPFRDYIAWLQRQDLSKAEAFWRDLLKGFKAPTPIGSDQGPQIADDEPAIGEQHINIPAQPLQALSRQLQLTLHTIVQGAWAILLSRYSGRDDIVFGTVVSGRPIEVENAESIVGLLVNTLPTRVRVDPNATLRSWLYDLQNQQAELRQYEYSPLVEIQNWSEVPHTQPLFESILGFRSFTVDGSARSLESDLKVAQVHYQGRASYPLTAVAAVAREITMLLEYDRRRFADQKITRMLEHFKALLESFCVNADRPLSCLSMTTASERARIIEEWSRTPRPIVPSASIQELIEAQVERAPDRVAAVFRRRQISYRELNERANRLAHFLRRRGVGPEALVGLYMDRGLDMLVAALAILKAGGAYVPLDPAHPKQRVEWQLGDCGAGLVLTAGARFAELSGAASEVICLDHYGPEIAREGRENPAPQGEMRNLAYLIYTSGSTGQPKAVMIEQANLCNVAQVMAEPLAVGPDSCVLQFASLCFDASVVEIFTPLVMGARMVVAERERITDAEEVMGLMQEGGVSVAVLPPTLLGMATGGELDGLATMASAGEACGREIVDRWGEGRRFVNVYGPTEITVCATAYVEEERGRKEVPVGRAIGNVEAYVLDGNRELVSEGVIGEVYIGGAGVGRGYKHGEEMTAERFVPNPYSRVQGGRMYKSGDLGRYLSDGQIEYLGRVDHQVKLRGYRVELGEIEATLAKHDGVHEAVVLVQEVEGSEKQLAAYLVVNPGKPPALADLREFLKGRLPDYMLPSRYCMLDAFPLSTNGKVDRKALLALGTRRDEFQGEFVAPRTPVEAALIDICARLLRIDKLGIDDNLFELGAHSLVATQIVSRVRAVLQVELPLRALFEEPSIRGLAGRIEAAMKSGGADHVPPPAPVPRNQPLPLSYAQQRLWFIDRLQEGRSSEYNSAGVYRLDGKMDVAALERTLSEIVRRHEVLRTAFPLLDGQPVQVIAPAERVRLAVSDLTDLPAAEREAAAKRLAGEEAQQPFDLANGPVFRARLFRLGEEAHVLLFVMHHIVCDAWSRDLLFNEAAILYEAFSQGGPSPLADPSIQYADYAIWQRQWLQGDVLDEQIAYWKRQLGDNPPALELPTDRPRPAVQTNRGASLSFSLSKPASEGIKALSHEEGATLYMTLLAAFQVLLYRYTRQEQILVGSPIANRGHADVERLLGFFVNTVVVGTRLSGELTFQDVIGRVRDAALGAYAHQDVPFERVVEELQTRRDMSRSPLFQVMFLFNQAGGAAAPMGDLRVSSLGTATRTASFDLTLDMQEGWGRLGGSVEYNTDLFDEATISRLIGHFETLLASCVADPTQPIAALPLLTAAEHQSLMQWGRAESPALPRGFVPELFEAQVERQPDRVAVVYAEEQMTYRELNAAANKLAHRLRAMGVGPESRVAICMDRSTEMIVGLLAILKAGGAYVPLDPASPKDYQRLILEDAQAALVLTRNAWRKDLQHHGVALLCLDSFWEFIDEESGGNLPAAISAENVAYIIFTSGSTGRPKGVRIPHGVFARFCQKAWDEYQLEPGDRILQFASVSFDASVEEIFPCLIKGAALVLRSNSMVDSPRAFLDECRHHALTVCQVPTAYWHHLAAEMEADALRLPAALRVVITGGERAVLRRLAQWNAAAGRDVQWFNTYGPTEATVTTTVWKQPPAGRPTPALYEIPIGRPMPGVQTYVLDERLQPTAISIAGELHVGGEGVALGYQNAPELTAERFIPDPYSQVPGARLYKTGDLARHLPDGNLEFVGRRDHQVKVRGFRIELGEIEQVLEQHGGVQTAVVLARETEAGEKRLLAYVVVHKRVAPAARDLRRFLRKRLPNYMIPSAFVLLDGLPMTAGGKVARQALPDPEPSRSEFETAYVAPRNGRERRLQEIWERILEVRPIGITDDFFQLGGHSFLAVRLMTEIRKEFSRNLPLATLFQGATIKHLAELLGDEVVALPWSPLVAIEPNGSKPPLFFVHSIGGEILSYYEIARHLDPDQPIYGLQAPTLAEAVDERVSVEEMASAYIEAIRTVQGEGEYFLGGYSFGGLVAFEMARQLRQQGEGVGLLVLLDTGSPALDEKLEVIPDDAFLIVGLLKEYARQLGKESPVAHEDIKHLALSEQIAYVLEQTHRTGLIPTDTDAYWLERFLKGYKARYQAALDYPAPIYSGDITLFRCTEADPHFVAYLEERGWDVHDSTLGWDRYTTGEVIVHPIPGYHETLWKEPCVQIVAQQLQACVAQALGRRFATPGSAPGTALSLQVAAAPARPERSPMTHPKED